MSQRFEPQTSRVCGTRRPVSRMNGRPAYASDRIAATLPAPSSGGSFARRTTVLTHMPRFSGARWGVKSSESEPRTAFSSPSISGACRCVRPGL